jgi:hypothetical protein
VRSANGRDGEPFLDHHIKSGAQVMRRASTALATMRVIWNGGEVIEQDRRLHAQEILPHGVCEKALIQGFHFPFPSAGYVEKEGAQY